MLASRPKEVNNNLLVSPSLPPLSGLRTGAGLKPVAEKRTYCNRIKIKTLCTVRLQHKHGYGGRSIELLPFVQGFDELLELASNGRNQTVDEYSNDLYLSSEVDKEEDQSIYSMMKDVKPALMFCFGKATPERRRIHYAS